MANGRAGRCHSKSHFCPLRRAGPALTERGSREEGEEGGKEPTEAVFFPRRGFLSIFGALVKTRGGGQERDGERAGWGPGVGKETRTEQVNAPAKEAEPGPVSWE